MPDILMMALRLKLKKISEPGLTDYRSIWKVADEGKKPRKPSKTVFLNTVARLSVFDVRAISLARLIGSPLRYLAYRMCEELSAT